MFYSGDAATPSPKLVRFLGRHSTGASVAVVVQVRKRLAQALVYVRTSPPHVSILVRGQDC